MPRAPEIYDLIKNDNWEGLELLVDRGLAVDAAFTIDNEQAPYTLLQAASGLGALKVIDGLIHNGANLEYERSYGTPLDCAVASDRQEAAKLLLEKGANPNAVGPSEVEGDGNWTPLLRAVLHKNLPVVELLLKFGANPRMVSRKGIGVITCAAHNQDIELVHRFLLAGVPVPGNALLCAVEKGNEKLVASLLKTGCDPSYIAGKVELADARPGETPLSLAIKLLSITKAMNDVSKAMKREEGQEARFRAIIALLLRAGADPNKKVQNRTPLSLAVWDRDVEIVRLLLASGADVSGTTYSPFVDYKDRKGDELGFYETALHSAVKNGDKEMVAELLKAGANPQAREHSGISVLELVRQSGDREMAALFERHSNERERGIHS